LPDKGSSDQKLKPVDFEGRWLAETLSDRAERRHRTRLAEEAVWLPTWRRQGWMEYVKTGARPQTSRRRRPHSMSSVDKGDQGVELPGRGDCAMKADRASSFNGTVRPGPTAETGAPLRRTLFPGDVVPRPA
jgi:hypothetical protein